jgi:hypothetical protein
MFASYLLARDQGIDRLERLRGPTEQRGAGGYTLCIACNERTGKLYAPSYGYWARQAAKVLVSTPTAPTVHIPFDIYPLRVVKQIACMFLCANSPSFQSRQPDLVRFVQNQHATAFPNHLRIYAYCTTSDRSRQAGVTSMLAPDKNGRMGTYVFSEISFRPFGYIMTIDCEPSDRRLLDISFFGTYSYNHKATLTLPLAWLPIYSPFPGDFRPRDQVVREAGDR